MSSPDAHQQLDALDALLHAVLATVTAEQKSRVVNYIRNDMEHVNITHEARMRAIEIMERSAS